MKFSASSWLILINKLQLFSVGLFGWYEWKSGSAVFACNELDDTHISVCIIQYSVCVCVCVCNGLDGPKCYFVHHKFHMHWPGSAPGLPR